MGATAELSKPCPLEGVRERTASGYCNTAKRTAYRRASLMSRSFLGGLMIRRIRATPVVLAFVVLLPSIALAQLKPDDRLAITGDSITEQKMYSVFIEDYLLACKPQA